MKKFINENGKEVLLDCFEQDDLVHMSISSKDSKSSWEVTPLEAFNLYKSLKRVLYCKSIFSDIPTEGNETEEVTR